MKYVVDEPLAFFKAWSGGLATWETLTFDELEKVEEGIEECYEGCELTETNINDFLWFERDTIAEWLGYTDWEDYLKHKESEV